MRFSRARQLVVAGLSIAVIVGGSAVALSSAALAETVSSPIPVGIGAPVEALASPTPSPSSADGGEDELLSGSLIEAASPAPASTHLLELPVPVITGPPAGTTSVSSVFTVSGTIQTDTDVTVVVEARSVDFFVGDCSTLVTAGSNAWECTLSLEYTGDLTLVAYSVENGTAEPMTSAFSAVVPLTIDFTAEAQFTSADGFSNTFAEPLTLDGTGPANGSVLVRAIYYPDFPAESGETTVDFCSAPIDAQGFWSCSGDRLENGGPNYYGYAYFQVYAKDFFGVDASEGFNDEVGGDIVFAPPTLEYTFTPATISVTATGEDDASIVVELYTATPNGEGYNYGFVERCGAVDSEGELSSEFTPALSNLECTFSALTPGIWNIYYQQFAGELSSPWVDEFVLIPEAPSVLASTVSADRSVRVSGEGTPGYVVRVVRGASDTPFCVAVVDEGGAWACSAPSPSGTQSFRAIQESVGFEADFGASYDGLSAASAAITAVVPAAPLPTLPFAPQSPTPVTPGTVEIVGLPSEAIVGSELEITGNTECISPVVCDVEVDIFSTPQRLGSTVTDAAGAFALRVTVPENLEPGEHTIVITVTPRGGTASTVSQGITISEAQVAAPSAPEPTSPAEDGSAAGESGSGGAVDRSDPAAPSAISDSIPTIDRIFRTPLIAGVAGGLALAILLLVAFPAELLNSTLASNTRRIGRWYAAIEDRVERATEWFSTVTRTRALAAAILVALTALIFGFVDPEYGFDPVSLRMTISLAIGLFVVTYVSAWISGAIIQRVWSIPTRVSLQPAALVFAVLGVIVARLLEFSPGFLIGLVIGLDLLTRVGAPHRVRATLTNIGVMVSLALLAWVGFSITSAIATGEPTVLGLLVSDALVATTAEGLTAALAALMPLGFLQGHEIFRRSKVLWAAVFATVAALFALIVLPTASGEEGEVADVSFWILVMVIFAVVTLTLWAVLQFTGRSDVDDADDEGAAALAPAAPERAAR